jgi:DNA polymerase (family 10)
VDNEEVAQVFQQIAELLELKGENPFKVRAYARAAETLAGLTEPLEETLAAGRLREIPGVGEAIAAKTEELLKTGRLGFYEKLKAEFPPGIFELTRVPGIGTRTAFRLAKELEIADLEALEVALREGQVARLPRMGEKTADNLRRALVAYRRRDQRIPLGTALPLAGRLTATLAGLPGVARAEIAGSVRRRLETVGNLDLAAATDDAEGALAAFLALPAVQQVVERMPTAASVLVSGAISARLRLGPPNGFGAVLQQATGSARHNLLLGEHARARGFALSEQGLTALAGGKLERFAEEAALYARLGLAWIPPELREGRDEIERAARGDLPRLVTPADLRGDLHVHTEWSDGVHTIREMAEAARARGLEYVAISDHSVGRANAQGLSPDRLRAQIAAVREAGAALPEITLLTSSEVDIRSDGSLDFADELLADLDVVTASIHTAMGQSRERMTERLIRAMENPHVDIIGHLSTRIIGGRDAVEFDAEAVLQAAARTGTAIEINAQPSRLDLRDTLARRARELGVKLVISSDSHASSHFDVLPYGVDVARRAGCVAEDILNTRPLAEFRRGLK